MRGRRRTDSDGHTRLPILADFAAVETFVAIMETRSISKAAQRLNTVPSAVSQRLSNLETLSETRLFNRTTRIVAPTDAARALYGHCKKIIACIDVAEQELWGDAALLYGDLRVAAPVYFGMDTIAPILPEFARLYPDLLVSLQLSARASDLIAEGLDLAIRFQPSLDPGNGERLLLENDRVFCAAPDYLARRGAPRRPQDLKDHDCICTLPSAPLVTWEYRGRDGIDRVEVTPVLQSDNPLVLIEAARQGLGIALLGRRAIAEWLARGELVTLLDDVALQSNYLVAKAPDSRYMPHRAKVFVDFLMSHIGDGTA
ncbi:LysR family transcriptional regulator [Salipiger abyssi]|uniref:LysR family transcriptional regulator n=1 Tax=Salipiger abyssi TaxID=1250539 RepID=UPI001A906869|nr:LysR family transcriptional regulator [Salipiger abyssi]MBN9888890.1 LysR family transcriptional regulator [Salipiger abyssi]